MPFLRFVDDTLFVLVVYGQQPDCCESIKTLSGAIDMQPQRPSLFVYDNSPEPQADKLPAGWSVTYVHDKQNHGVAPAYNHAASLAQASGKKWMLLMDQDMSFPPNILNAYETALARFPDHVLFAPIVSDAKGILSPFEFRHGGGIRKKNVEAGVQSLSINFVINSGMLILNKTFMEAGGYDERFPLDFSDIMFCTRLKPFVRELVIVNAECHAHFSGAEMSSLPEALGRFRTYLAALQELRRTQPGLSGLQLRSIKRALSLTLRYKSPGFMRQFFRDK